MAQNIQASRSKWGMGQLLQQAVAGVESRLDNILNDGEVILNHNTTTKITQLHQAGASPVRHSSDNITRGASNARKNDRLQERLARAVAKQNTTATDRSSSSRPSSPASSLAQGNDGRSSFDIESSEAPLSPKISRERGSIGEETTHTLASPEASYDPGAPPRDHQELAAVDVDGAPNKANGDIDGDDENTVELVQHDTKSPLTSEPASVPSEHSMEATRVLPATYESTILQMQSEHKTAEYRWREEMYAYIERVDALQSKLKYLAKDAAESAKKAAESVDPGAVERQLLEKNEKIALLLEEGQKLSKSEFDHRIAIKKLRQQLAESSKIHTEATKRQEKLERDLASAEARAKRAEAVERGANESLSSQLKTSHDLETITAERNMLKGAVEELKAQLARAAARANAAETKAHSDALEQEKRRVIELDEELLSAKTERVMAEEKLRREISGLKGSIEQEKEKARTLEAELKNEQCILETKMESLRSKAEEASSGITGDAQAKLLRQIETLQAQYSAASENWQALESSLLSRLASTERERDDAVRREVDMRRKTREMTLRAKKAEDEAENAKEVQRDLESRLEERLREAKRLEQKLEMATNDLARERENVIEQRKISDATWAQKLEEERTKWQEQVSSATCSLPQPRNGSPVPSYRTSNLEPVGRASDYRPTSRRSSMIPPPLTDAGIPLRQNSYSSAMLSPQVSSGMPNTPVIEGPSITFELDEFSGFGTPVTPSLAAAQTQHSRGINDIISDSTTGAGPSVQLVERMSAMVRRLENERAASKDELARITSQRDEARQQVVDQMREIEEKRASDTHIQELEAQIQVLNQRYQVTLEMLGEKSEQVDELQADIADIKKMYRELVDSTMR